MNDQTVMGPLVELPGWLQWLQASGWGALSASGLPIGAVGGYYTSLRHTTIARTMTFAAGVLLAVVAIHGVCGIVGAPALGTDRAAADSEKGVTIKPIVRIGS
jgi:ammonia channel protein AmtB